MVKQTNLSKFFVNTPIFKYYKHFQLKLFKSEIDYWIVSFYVLLVSQLISKDLLRA